MPASTPLWSFRATAESACFDRDWEQQEHPQFHITYEVAAPINDIIRKNNVVYREDMPEIHETRGVAGVAEDLSHA